MSQTLCTNCGKRPAKEYLRKTEGKEIKLLLCPSCYSELYPATDDDFFTSFLGNVGAKKSCPACGTTLDDFRSSGLLGCAYCYTAFRAELIPTVRYIHHDNIQHRGKSPDTGAEEKYDLVRELVREQEEVKENLERAISGGDYVAADRFRLRLKEINRKLYGGAES